MGARNEVRRSALAARVLAASIGCTLVVALGCEPSARTTADPGRAATAATANGDLARTLCEATCARAIRCEGPRSVQSRCDCGSVREGDLLRADWARADLACLSQSSCDAPADCEASAYRAIGAAPLAWPPVVMRCLARGDTCGGSSATCRRLAAMTDGARAEASPCFDQPCEEYAACFAAFLSSRVAPAVPAWR